MLTTDVLEAVEVLRRAKRESVEIAKAISDTRQLLTELEAAQRKLVEASADLVA